MGGSNRASHPPGRPNIIPVQAARSGRSDVCIYRILEASDPTNRRPNQPKQPTNQPTNKPTNERTKQPTQPRQEARTPRPPGRGAPCTSATASKRQDPFQILFKSFQILFKSFSNPFQILSNPFGSRFGGRFGPPFGTTFGGHLGGTPGTRASELSLAGFYII